MDSLPETTIQPKESDTAALEVASRALLDLGAADLFRAASHVKDRMTLIRLAKEHHIKEQNFEVAAALKDMQKHIQNSIDVAVHRIGAGILDWSNAEVSDGEKDA